MRRAGMLPQLGELGLWQHLGEKHTALPPDWDCCQPATPRPHHIVPHAAHAGEEHLLTGKEAASWGAGALLQLCQLGLR